MLAQQPHHALQVIFYPMVNFPHQIVPLCLGLSQALFLGMFPCRRITEYAYYHLFTQVVDYRGSNFGIEYGAVLA